MTYPVGVDFKVVEVWWNPSHYGLYTYKPINNQSEKQYAILIGHDHFLLGGYDDAIYVDKDFEGD